MAGENNNMGIRRYETVLKDILPGIYNVYSYFGEILPMQALDGVREKDVAFTIKVNCTPVTIGTYNTGANVGMGTGTGSTSRFGNRVEIIHTNVTVPYSWTWAYHEGIDKHTTNEDFDVAVAERLELEAQAMIGKFNTQQASYLSTNAGKTVSATVADINAITTAEVTSIFNQLAAWFINKKVNPTLTKIAYVRAELYNAIVDNGLSTTAKGSDVNIDRNEVKMFKGFVILERPEDAFQTGEYAIATVANVGVAYTGIETARAIASEDFDGTALQGAGKAGEWVSTDNKVALAKVALTVQGA